MIATGKTDRRVLRTRKAIMDAFDRLVVANGIEKLTVSALAREADIDRKTFYLHYKSVDELVNKRAESSLDRVISALVEKGADKTPIERVHIELSEVNAELMENLDLYSSIATSLSVDQSVERFYTVVSASLDRAGIEIDEERADELKMRTQFYIAGAFSLYSSWLKSDHSKPIEAVSDTIELALQSSVFPPLCPPEG